VYVEIFLEFDAERKMGKIQYVINAIERNLERKISGSEIIVSPKIAPVA